MKRPIWIRVVMVLAFVVSLGWMEFSGLWNSRWTGFLLGAAYMAAALWLDWRRIDGSKHSKRYYLSYAAFFLVLATVSFIMFFLGFRNFAGFLGFLFLTFGLRLLLTTRWQSELSLQEHTING
jgi:hypothetical protein